MNSKLPSNPEAYLDFLQLILKTVQESDRNPRSSTPCCQKIWINWMTLYSALQPYEVQCAIAGAVETLHVTSLQLQKMHQKAVPHSLAICCN
ncbi:hypothetical protein [Microseira sp. BLCC-F43]|jgi:hypothetical protein|uniref:hypothetical protein n=1 Tax=Microseira sp. BLCC-F43 TaxID=3153602 RepID=UPI0035B6D107